MGKKLTKIKFHSIARDIKDGRRSVEEMASFHHVSSQTIRTVKRTKTWPGFVLAKQQRMSYIANAKDQKFHDAQRAGLKPVSRSQEKRLTAVEDRERQLGVDLRMNEKYVSRDEYEKTIARLHELLHAHSTILSRKADKKVWPWGRR